MGSARALERRARIAVRIGVVTHTLIAKKLKADQHTKREAAMPKNTHVAKEADFDEMLDD